MTWFAPAVTITSTPLRSFSRSSLETSASLSLGSPSVGPYLVQFRMHQTNELLGRGCCCRFAGRKGGAASGASDAKR